MNKNLYQQLLALTPIEKIQQQFNHFQSDFDQKSLINKNTDNQLTLPVFTDEFFKNKQIYISKHNRFAAYPEHAHTFLEANYLLQGHADETVNRQSVQLDAGDLLIMDVGTTHAISALHHEDLLLNLIIRDHLNDENDQFLQIIKSQLSQKGFWLLPKNAMSPQMQSLLQQLITEYYNPGKWSEQLLNSYLTSCLILLARLAGGNNPAAAKPESAPVQLVLQEISHNYPSASLKKIAQRLNYTPTYLGQLFKKETGSTFSAALTSQRMLSAYHLLITTSLSVAQIMTKVGISNRSFFYHKFEEQFGQTPNKIRQEKC